MHGVMHTQLVEEGTHEAARREHDIAPCVKPAHIAPEYAFARTADAASDDLRQIRVLERRKRNTPTLRHPPCTPCRMERVPDFDQVWLQPVQQSGPAARVE